MDSTSWSQILATGQVPDGQVRWLWLECCSCLVFLGVGKFPVPKCLIGGTNHFLTLQSSRLASACSLASVVWMISFNGCEMNPKICNFRNGNLLFAKLKSVIWKTKGATRQVNRSKLLKIFLSVWYKSILAWDKLPTDTKSMNSCYTFKRML